MSREAEKYRTGQYHDGTGRRVILYKPGDKYIKFVTIECEQGVKTMAKTEGRYITPLTLTARTKTRQYPVRKMAQRMKKRLRDRGIKPSKNVKTFLSEAANQRIDVEETF